MLTAAHCVPSDFVLYDQACAVDADCPDVSLLNGAVTLECDPAESQCRDPDPLVTNGITHAQFGTEYSATQDIDGDLPRKSIQILYCHKVINLLPGGMGTNPNDFAYCVLSDEPNLQPTPISTPCEDQAELLAGTEIFAVGFGQSALVVGMEDTGGTKRWATATLPTDTWTTTGSILHAPTGLEWTSEGGIPVSLGSGDSGGPLFARMSDGTLRVIGNAQTSVGWGRPFHHIDWLLADPNIDVADVLPCHDATGAFIGGTACGETPTSPDQPSGQWERGEHACHTETTLQMTNLCVAMMEKGSALAPLDLKTPEVDGGSSPVKSATPGCRFGGSPPPVELLIASLLGLLPRRRRS